jgi:UDP-2,4-diacetamido-2,4,6-trideoxy-beta-L-altropyranose hydrolase
MSGAGASGFAVFRADASATVGAGHVMRCLTLARRLAEEGWRFAFASAPGTPAAVPELAGVELSEAVEPGAMALRWPGGCDLLVVDSYALGRDFERACRPWARRILAIDDAPSRPHDADLLLDQTLGRAPADYAGLVPPGCAVLAGTPYALLRPGFAAARPAALGRRAAGGPARRLLVSLGQGDPDDATGLVLDGVAEAALDLEVDVVMGAAAPHLESVRRRAARVGARVLVSVADMDRLSAEADIALGAGGVTAWERCALGLPTILVQTAANQADNAAALAAAGAALDLGPLPGVTPARVAEALRRLAGDAPARLAMARAAGTLCDGYGVHRAAIALSPASAGDGYPVSLRPVTSADAGITLDWQRDPSTRRHFRNPAAPTRQEHLAWLAARLSDPGCLMSLVLHGGEPAGVLRLDRLPAGRGGGREVSILVAPDRRGRGVGAAALALAPRLVPGERLVAEVLPGNAASLALFARAGYRAAEDGLLTLAGAA